MPAAVAGFFAAAAKTAIGAAIIRAGVSLAISYVVSRITQPKGQSPRDARMEIRQSDAPRVRYVGPNRVTGALMYEDVHDNALWKLMATAQGGQGPATRWWVGGEEVTVVDNAVTTGPAKGRAKLWTRAGRYGQIDGGDYGQLRAVAPAWTPNHKLTGVGTVLARFDCVKAEDANKVYPGGDPEVSVETGGDDVRSPDGNMFGRTENLARQLADILTHPEYGPLSLSDLHAPDWWQAISDCGDAVPTAGGTRPRFAGGGGYRLNEPIKDVADRWCEAMAAKVYLTTTGQVGIRAGVWRAPSHTITADKIISMEWSSGADDIDGVGALVPKFTSPALGYKETTADAWEDPAALARWGETAAKEMPLPIVQHHGQARHLAKIKLARMNPKWRVEMTLTFWGLLLLEEQTVTVNLPHRGIVNQPFWIERFGFDAANGVCTVTLAHAVPQSLNVVAAHDGAAPAQPPATGGGRVLPAPVITQLAVIRDDGPVYVRLNVQVTGSTSLVAMSRKSGSSGPWSFFPMGISGSGVMRSPPLEDGSRYDFMVGSTRMPFVAALDPDAVWTTITDVEVLDNTIAPDPPVVTAQSGNAGGTLSVTFEPDLGVNYRLTRLYQAGPSQGFAAATAIRTTTATSQIITLNAPIPGGGARYWLQSENGSGVKSNPTLVGTYT